MNCLAQTGDHAVGDEYGYNKQQVVESFIGKYKDDVNAYKSGTKDIKLNRL